MQRYSHFATGFAMTAILIASGCQTPTTNRQPQPQYKTTINQGPTPAGSSANNSRGGNNSTLSQPTPIGQNSALPSLGQGTSFNSQSSPGQGSFNSQPSPGPGAFNNPTSQFSQPPPGGYNQLSPNTPTPNFQPGLIQSSTAIPQPQQNFGPVPTQSQPYRP